MTVHEFGDKSLPVIIMLFPGMMSYWKGNYGGCIRATYGCPLGGTFAAITGRDKYDMSFITKESLKNQFRSDLITPLPEHIENGETEIHVFYAKRWVKNTLKDTAGISRIPSYTRWI